MLKIYETVQSTSSNHTITAVIILLISLTIAAITSLKMIRRDRHKIIDFVWASSILAIIFSIIYIIGSAIVSNVSDASSKELNKDQYQLKVINHQIIKTDNDKHIMKIDDKEFDALKILAITDNAYVVEGTSKDNSLHKVFELKKSDHNFKEE